MNLPNLLTSIRILLLPIFLIYLINDEVNAAFFVFVIAGITDGLDGFLARLFKQTTQLGAYLDPLADKILLTSSFIILALKRLVPYWLTILVVTRDFLILVGVVVLFLLQKRETRIGPSILSKINTCFQIVCVATVLSVEIIPIPKTTHIYLFGITAFTTVISGLHYLYEWLNILNPQDAQITSK